MSSGRKRAAAALAIKQLDEPIEWDIGYAEDGAQRAAGNLSFPWDSDRASARRPESYVAAGLAGDLVA